MVEILATCCTISHQYCRQVLVKCRVAQVIFCFFSFGPPPKVGIGRDVRKICQYYEKLDFLAANFGLKRNKCRVAQVISFPFGSPKRRNKT